MIYEHRFPVVNGTGQSQDVPPVSNQEDQASSNLHSFHASFPNQQGTSAAGARIEASLGDFIHVNSLNVDQNPANAPGESRPGGGNAGNNEATDAANQTSRGATGTRGQPMNFFDRFPELQAYNDRMLKQYAYIEALRGRRVEALDLRPPSRAEPAQANGVAAGPRVNVRPPVFITSKAKLSFRAGSFLKRGESYDRADFVMLEKHSKNKTTFYKLSFDADKVKRYTTVQQVPHEPGSSTISFVTFPAAEFPDMITSYRLLESQADSIETPDPAASGS